MNLWRHPYWVNNPAILIWIWTCLICKIDYKKDFYFKLVILLVMHLPGNGK